MEAEVVDAGPPDLSAFMQVPKDETFNGEVQRVEVYGVFVDVQHPDGGRPAPGFLHVSEMPTHQQPVAKHFTVGQQVRVQVAGVNEERQQLSLSMQREDIAAFLRVPRDQVLTATINSISGAAIFAQVRHPDSGGFFTGLVHYSVRQSPLLEHFAVGQEVSVQIENVDEEKQELRLVIAGTFEHWSTFKEVREDQWLTGIIQGLAPFGLYVEVEHPESGKVAVGMVHVSEVSRTFISGAELPKRYRGGQEVRVRVKSAEGDKLSLSMLEKVAEEEDEMDLAAFRNISSEASLPGRVARIFAFGLQVRVLDPPGLGLVHLTEIPASQQPLAKHFHVDQQVTVKVLRTDEAEKQLFLSMGAGAEDISAFLEVPREQRLTGIIDHEVPNGLVVQVEHPESGRFIQGFVYANRMVQGDFQKGQKIAVRVDNVDRTTFTMKEPVDYVALAKAPREDWHRGTVMEVVAGGSMLVEAQVAGQTVVGLLPPLLARRKLRKGKEVHVQLADVSLEKKQVRFTNLDASGASTGSPSDDAAPKDASQQDAQQHNLSADVCEVLQRYDDALKEQGYDSPAALKQLSVDEWLEMKRVCGLRPGHAAKLRAALHPEWG